MLYFTFKVIIGLFLSVLAYNVWLTLWYYRIVKFSWKFRGGFLPLLPFVGNLYVWLFTGRKVTLISIVQWIDKYIGMPANIWYNYKYHYLCSDAKECRIILNHPKCYNKAQLYDDFKYGFGDSLLFVSGEKWKCHRRHLRGAFKSSLLNSFIPTLYQQSSCLVEQVKSIGPDEDLFKFFNKYTLTNFFLTSAGLQEHQLDVDIDRIGELSYSTMQEAMRILANPVMPMSIWTKIPPGAKFRKEFEELKQIFKKVFLKAREKRAEISEYTDGTSEVPLIDLILSDRYEKSNETEVFDEFFLFANAATETTGHTLTFCFTLLGMHQDIQQRLFEEVISAVGERKIESIDISGLKYTEAVISETLRILPTVPAIGRYCAEDIDTGTNIIPKGANVLISIYHIHRNPAYWKDPLKFDPSRFFPENVSKIVPGSYLPFSSGPRNCIGQAAALIQLKITVADVIKNYRIISNHASVDEFILKSSTSMRTEDSPDCKFIPRFKSHM